MQPTTQFNSEYQHYPQCEDSSNTQPAASEVQGKNWSSNPYAQAATQLISSHVLSGLSKIWGFDILRHGTSWSNYKSIVQNGADPKRGGTTTDAVINKKLFAPPPPNEEGEKATLETPQGKFYVFRDSRFGVYRNPDGKEVDLTKSQPKSLFKRILPNFFSYYAYGAECSDKELSLSAKISNFFKALFTPKLKFIFSRDEIQVPKKIFIDDPDFLAYSAAYTTNKIDPDRIGLIGLFNQKSAQAEYVENYQKDTQFRGRRMAGVAQVAAGIFLTVIGLGAVT